MRKKLKNIDGQRMQFRAKVVRYGAKKAFKGPDIDTILLQDVVRVDTGQTVCDHLWFTAGKSWEGFKAGEHVSFYARVSDYVKGYQGYRDDIYDKPVSLDYRLERPTKVQSIAYCESS